MSNARDLKIMFGISSSRKTRGMRMGQKAAHVARCPEQRKERWTDTMDRQPLMPAFLGSAQIQSFWKPWRDCRVACGIKSAHPLNQCFPRMIVNVIEMYI